MNTKPSVNALVAAGYISIFVTVLFNLRGFSDQELGMMAPFIALSLLVLSAALMGYLFFYQPVRLLIEGKQEEAGRFLLSTIAWFLGTTVVVLGSWFLLSTLL